MKNIITIILSSMFLGLCILPSNAQDDLNKNNYELKEEIIQLKKEQNEQSNTIIKDYIIPEQLENEIKKQILDLYGEQNVDVVYKRIYEIAKNTKVNRNEALLKNDISRDADWYKDEIVYMFYADQFGVKNDSLMNKFNDTAKMLDYLKDLGVTTLYILPFAESPMGDAGFDVKNPKNVRADLGGMPEFMNFLREAKNRGFKIKVDIVLNHLSDENKWFQELLNGDESKLDYFIVKDKMPEYKRYKDEILGEIVEYTEEDGTITKRRLIFPEISENHYREITVNGKKYYIYHTFYPFQPDVNWNNPEVLYYYLDIISYWANFGMDIFRLDAIPYLHKENGDNGENHPNTHKIIKLINAYLQAVSPRSVMQAEACQPPKDILKYFGNERKIELATKDESKKITRTDEVQIAYHFPYMPAMWATLITQDSKYFKQAHKETPSIPESASWAVFLRVHDELSLEMATPETREIIFNALVDKGAPFREGFGVSGRMANFLDNNPNRIGMAFSMLMSMPGVPIIYYGDEIGVKNNYENADKNAKLREKKLLSNKLKMLSCFDSRDINRGVVTQKLFEGSSKDYYIFNSKIYRQVKNIIEVRKSNQSIRRGSFNILNTNSDKIFAYSRKYNNERVMIINNLSDEKMTAEVTLPIDLVLKSEQKTIKLYDLISDEEIRVGVSLVKRKIIFKMQPYEYVWFSIEKQGFKNPFAK